MASEIETLYDNFIANLKGKLSNVDPNFATRLMYMERKIPDTYQPTIKPHVALSISYKNNVDRDKKQQVLREKYGTMVESLDKPNEILCMGYMDIPMIEELSKDKDIESISGKVSAILRG